MSGVKCDMVDNLMNCQGEEYSLGQDLAHENNKNYTWLAIIPLKTLQKLKNVLKLKIWYVSIIFITKYV